jgi:hypothetical protein
MSSGRPTHDDPSSAQAKGDLWQDRRVARRPTAQDDTPDATAFAAIRGQLAALREGLDRIEGDLRVLERRQRTVVERPRPARFYEVLVGVYEHGIHGIGDQALNLLAGEQGYERRGLNGFFTGARAALARSGGRVVLTPEGQRLVEVHLRQVHGGPLPPEPLDTPPAVVPVLG